MERTAAISILSALAQPTRLATVALLVSAGDAGLNAGELSTAIGTPANTMSAHLTVLSHAGLVEQTRTGRNIRYRALPESLSALSSFVKQLASGEL